MSNIEKSIDVHVPVHVAYNQWTQFEEFPQFMSHVKEVKQVDEAKLHWRAEFGGKEKEWDAVITEQIPDTRIAWRDAEGLRTAGALTFHRISDESTRMMLQMEYVPEGMAETVGDKLGLVSSAVDEGLQGFKEFIEERGKETGAWRGEIPQEKK